MARVAEHYEQVEIKSVAALRKWLKQNHGREQGVWLVHHKKHSPHYVPYGAIVDELLCIGWIDGLVRKVDADRTMHLISPRKPKSIWSRVNKNKVAKLEREGRMTDAGRAVIDRAKEDGSWTIYDDVEKMVVPADLAQAFDKRARAAWEAFPDSVKKGALWWVKSAKTQATRQKRIDKTAAMTRHGLRVNVPEDERKFRELTG